MSDVLPEEITADDATGTLVQGPEMVYVAIASQPPLNTQIITVHITLEGANAQLKNHAADWGVDPRSVGIVERLPLLP